jgi:hypothetical protein
MIYVSNISEVLTKLGAQLSNIDLDKAMREIASDVMFSNMNRVYTIGQNLSESGRIGTYSTKNILIGATSFRKKSSVNKVFTKKGLGLEWVRTKGNPRHSLAILPGGYKEIRNIDGDETNFVNLKRTGKMMKDLSFQKVGGVWCIGFPANYNSKLSYSEMVEHFRHKYKQPIWGVSQSDEKKIEEVILRYVKKALK